MPAPREVPAWMEEDPHLSPALYDTGIDPDRLFAELEAMVDDQAYGGDAA